MDGDVTGKRGPRRAVSAAHGRENLRQAKARDNEASPLGHGAASVTVYEPKAGRYKRRMARVGLTPTAGGISHDPALSIAWRIRRALTTEPRAPVTVYNAAGDVVATIDPVTRARTPLAAREG